MASPSTRTRILPFIAAAALGAMVEDATAEPLAIKEAFKPRSFYSMQLSPDGKNVVAIGHANGGAGLVLIDTQTSQPTLLNLDQATTGRPFAAHWVGNQLLAVDTPRGSTLVRMSGEVVRRIGGRYIRSLPPDADGHTRVLTVRPGRSGYIDRVDLRTGESTLTNFGMPGDPIRWVYDDAGNARVVTTISTAFWSDDTTITHWYRASIDNDWMKLASFGYTDEYWMPMYMMRDGRSLAVSSRAGRDTQAYFRYDLGEHRIAEMLAGHPTQDIYAHRGEADENYDLVMTQGMKPEFEWLDARWAQIQGSLDAAIPDRINQIVGRAPDKALVYSYSDVDPGRWFVLDTKRMAVREIAAAKPEIDPARMHRSKVVSYPSSDDMIIPAYLTLPADGARANPTIVMIHGGPIARDRWVWNPEVQLLASRGYAVFLPQFRGSSGFGKRFEVAGYGQWGLAMQDDVTAGVRWLVEQGIADPDRICIYGGSYGGYAAMWGLVKTPDLYRCGASFAGVSDLETMLKGDSDVNGKATGRIFLRTTIGDLKANKQRFDDVSPLKSAVRIKVPVLIAHGKRDVRVPIEHAEKMVDALKGNNKQHEWMEFEEEGHGIRLEKNQQRFYQALLAFFDKHIGNSQHAAKPPAEPRPAAN